MKICLVSHTFPETPQSGNAAFMHALASGLQKSGKEVTVLLPYIKEIDPASFPYKVKTYFYVWPKSLHTLGYANSLNSDSSLKIRAYLLGPLMVFFGFIALIQLVRKEHFDIVSAHWLIPNGFIAYLASKFCAISYVVTLPGSDVYLAKKNFLFSLVAKISANNASSIISDSPKYLELLKSTGARPKNSEIIPYPVDMEYIKSGIKYINKTREVLGMNSDNVIILAVGRLVEKKGFHFLIQTLPEITRSFPQVRLLIVGEGALRESLEQLIAKLRQEKFVFFAGQAVRNKLFSYYWIADIFVMPSIEDEKGNIDDQPVALIEAMSQGLPVVATNFPGISLTVQNGKSGILVEQKDTKGIFEALKTLIEKPQLRQAMGEVGEKFVWKNLISEKIAKRYIRVFEEIVKNRYE